MEWDIDSGETGGGAEERFLVLGRIDQYEILKELGTGGFGSVYLARDTVSRTFVAVKGLPALVKNNAEEMERIQENFALVSRLHHPNIAAALVLRPANVVSYSDQTAAEKLNVKSGNTLMVMEYASGVTLTKWRRQFPERKVPLDKAIEIVRQVAAAMDYAHQRKIIHRDIKPSNVMVETHEDGTFTVRVLDFGLAAEVRSSMNRVSKEVSGTSGTRQYMAPEQWAGKKRGAATDQYSLAVLFHELVTGSIPFASAFECDDPIVMMTAVTTQEAEIPTDLPKRIRVALKRGLNKNRDLRFKTCADFVAALDGKKISGNGMKRSGLLVSLGMIVALVLIIVYGTWWFGLNDANSQSEDGQRPGTVVSALGDTEHEVFRLSSRAASAHEMIEREPSEVRTFFAAEIRAIENDRRAGDSAKELSKNAVAVKFFTQALEKADALRKLVSGRENCEKARIAVVEVQKRALGSGADKDDASGYKEAFRLLQKGDDAGRAKRFDEALSFYRKSASGFEDSISETRANDVLQMLEKSSGGKIGVQDVEHETSNFRQRRQKAENGDAGAQNDIGIMFFKGKDVRQDYKEAYMWFKRAAEQGLSDGQSNLGMMYEQGKGIGKNDVEAAKWYQKAAEQGNAVAQFKLARMYKKGIGVNKDVEASIRLYQKAAEQGHAPAQTLLGCFYVDGDGVPQDWSIAYSWFLKAAERGYAQAQYMIGYAYLTGRGIRKDLRLAVVWYRKAADQGYAKAENQLGNLYYNGEGVEKDVKEALQWYRKSAEKGLVDAQLKLGMVYILGSDVKKNASEAEKWFRKAAEQGDPKGQFSVGLLYATGEGVTKDPAMAIRWYRKAAEQGDAEAQCNLADMYERGEGVEKNLTEALRWYRKSADQGLSVAQYSLGQIYCKGNGVEKNVEEAKKWYLKAAAQGLEESRQELRRMGYDDHKREQERKESK